MFGNWKNLCNALTEFNAGGGYAEEIEEYRQVLKGISCDYEYTIDSILHHAIYVEKMDPTECLNDYLSTVLDGGCRYALENTEIIEYAIKELIWFGAKFPYKRLFEKRIPEDLDGRYNEDEIYDYHVRGYLIDLMKPEYANDYASWAKIQATYWEDIPEGVTTDEFRFMYLKHCSKYLQSF